MTRKLTDRSIRALKTKKKLFQSASKLIEKYGYDNVTIEEICRKADVSVGAFYHYYKSKSDIIVEFFKQIDYYYEEKVQPELTNDADENINTFFRHYAQFHIEKGFEHTSMIVRIQTDFFLDKTRYMHILLIDLVKAAKKEGVFKKDADIDTIAAFLLVIARGLLFDWCLERGKYDFTSKMNAYIQIAKRAFQ